MSYFHVHLLNENARVPKRGSMYAAGYDISASENVIIEPRGRKVVLTGISCEIPAGHYVRVAPRSGLAAKCGIDVGAGVIDADYRGEIGVVLFNHSDVAFDVKIGDRIAQIIIEVIATPEITVVGRLGVSERGTGGFGSTGDKVIASEK